MAEHSSGAFRTSIGGQAIVVRDKDGQLVEKVEELKLIKDRYPILGIPLIRGTVNFLAAMVSGVKALMYSADFYPEEEESQPSKFEQWLEKHLSSEKLEKAVVGLAVLLGVGMSIFLFLVLPTLLTGGILHFFPGFPLWGRNVVEGLLKIAIFLAYLILCSKQKDIYRVFQYHGAEHKTIFCYEAGLPLTVENVRIQPRHHPRCGTSFLFVVIFVSILVSSVVFGIWPITNAGLRTLVHLLLLPLVVGITYEFNRWVGRHVQDSKLAQFLTAPGLWMQNFTTNEPDDSMLEVAIEALKLVLPVVASLLTENGRVANLIKPQFEAGKGKVGKKGVVREPEIHLEVLEKYIENAHNAGFKVLNVTFSPIKGPEGNIEFLGYLAKEGEENIPDLAEVVRQAHEELDS